jgi:myosin-5
MHNTQRKKEEKNESMLIICTALMQVLSVQQIYKICTQYWDDKYNTESVSEEVRSTYVHDDRWKICVR